MRQLPCCLIDLLRGSSKVPGYTEVSWEIPEVYIKVVCPKPIIVHIECVVQSKCPLFEDVVINQIFISKQALLLIYKLVPVVLGPASQEVFVLSRPW